MKFIENRWYPACLLEELTQQNPLPKTILGRELVIFRNEKGQISVIENRCCHRNVHLSLGEVVGEILKCAYHGWEYNLEGECVHIPSLPQDKKIPNACKVNKFPIRLHYKMVWVWLGDFDLKDSVDLPPMPEMESMPRVYNYHY